MHSVAHPCHFCAVRRLQIPHDIPAAADIDNIACYLVNLHALVVLLPCKSLYLLHDKTANPSPHLNGNWSISCYANPHFNLALHVQYHNGA